MASPTITKEMREKIVENMTKHIFGKEEAALVKRTAKLALAAYNEEHSPKVRKMMKDLGENYVASNTAINLNIRGMHIWLSFNGCSSLYGSVIGDGQEDVCRYGTKSRYGRTPFAPSASLSDEISELMDDLKDFSDRVRKAGAQTLAVLESVRTFKKLRAVWPQGEKFYDMYDVDSEKPGVPAIVITDLNKMLGL